MHFGVCSKLFIRRITKNFVFFFWSLQSTRLVHGYSFYDVSFFFIIYVFFLLLLPLSCYFLISFLILRSFSLCVFISSFSSFKFFHFFFLLLWFFFSARRLLLPRFAHSLSLAISLILYLIYYISHRRRENSFLINLKNMLSIFFFLLSERSFLPFLAHSFPYIVLCWLVTRDSSIVLLFSFFSLL